jgi:hypothetical protein
MQLPCRKRANSAAQGAINRPKCVRRTDTGRDELSCLCGCRAWFDRREEQRRRHDNCAASLGSVGALTGVAGRSFSPRQTYDAAVGCSELLTFEINADQSPRVEPRLKRRLTSPSLSRVRVSKGTAPTWWQCHPLRPSFMAPAHAKINRQRRHHAVRRSVPSLTYVRAAALTASSSTRSRSARSGRTYSAPPATWALRAWSPSAAIGRTVAADHRTGSRSRTASTTPSIG